MLSPDDRARLEALNTTHLRIMTEDRKRLTADGSIVALDEIDRHSRKHLVGAMRQCEHRFDMARHEKRFVLELGPGNGFDRDYLMNSFNAKYIGIDAVAETAHKLKKLGVHYSAIEDMASVIDQESVHFIYSRHVMEHVANADAAIAAIRHVLAPNGVVGAVTPYQFPDPEPAHLTQLDLDGWSYAYARHGLKVVYMQVHDFRVPEAHIIAVRADWPVW